MIGEELAIYSVCCDIEKCLSSEKDVKGAWSERHTVANCSAAPVHHAVSWCSMVASGSSELDLLQPTIIELVDKGKTRLSG